MNLVKNNYILKIWKNNDAASFHSIRCKPNAGLVSKQNDVVVNKPIEICKVKENEVASTYLSSDELEGRRVGQ
jgi:hypothetical protein